MKHYFSLNEYYRQKYGKKVYRIALSGGMTCPNRDGTVGTRGCIFCSAGGSGEFAASCALPIAEQITQAIRRIGAKTKDNAYIAYFQPFSNTYADADTLRMLYDEAISPENIVGLAVATRPDCLPSEVLSLLARVNAVKPVTVELGLQTIHASTAAYIRRGYPLAVYDEAVRNLRRLGIEVVTHVILGLPGETPQMMADTVRYVGGVTDGIKLQLLHVLDHTDLAEDYRQGRFEALSMEAYTEILCRCIELLPEDVVVYRITGDGDKRSLIAPLWSADKKRVLNYIGRYMDEHRIRQGRSFIP